MKEGDNKLSLTFEKVKSVKKVKEIFTSIFNDLKKLLEVIPNYPASATNKKP